MSALKPDATKEATLIPFRICECPEWCRSRGGACLHDGREYNAIGQYTGCDVYGDIWILWLCTECVRPGDMEVK